MRRIALAASLAGALVMSSPALAQAHGSHRRHHHHKHAHAQARVETFGPTQTSTPAPPTEETAGKVASFANGVLTLTLNDGSSISGKVTEQTEIKCESAAPMAQESDFGGNGNDGNGNEGNGGHSSRDDEHESSHAGENEQEDDGEGEVGPCGTSALETGAVVRRAELLIGAGGAVFTEIELVK